MEKQIQPNVAMHGGEVKVIDFDMDTGILRMLLSGSCSGCSSSTVTLKLGIENMLKHYIPEITQVVGEDDPNFNDPYYSEPQHAVGYETDYDPLEVHTDYDPLDRL